MRRRGEGRIANIASIGGKISVPHLVPYSASKFALVGLSEGLRAELAKDGIAVITICPGLMRTGSPRHAIFKGRHRAEYAWFSISDALPLVSMDADRAASTDPGLDPAREAERAVGARADRGGGPGARSRGDGGRPGRRQSPPSAERWGRRHAGAQGRSEHLRALAVRPDRPGRPRRAAQQPGPRTPGGSSKVMPQKTSPKRALRPPQRQRRQPGLETRMTPRPQADRPLTRGTGKLRGKVALITGGDSGIGRAVAIAFAKEGADVAIVYLNEHGDARETVRLVEQCGVRAVRIAGDVGREPFCREAVRRTIRQLGRVNILVNNAAEQHPRPSLHDITAAQLERTFRTNIFSFYMTKAALRHLRRGRRDHQYQFGHGVPRESPSPRLRGDEGCDRRVHAFPVAGTRRARHPRERRGARADLDSSDPRVVSSSQGRHVRIGRAAWSSR